MLGGGQRGDLKQLGPDGVGRVRQVGLGPEVRGGGGQAVKGQEEGKWHTHNSGFRVWIEQANICRAWTVNRKSKLAAHWLAPRQQVCAGGEAGARSMHLTLEPQNLHPQPTLQLSSAPT